MNRRIACIVEGHGEVDSLPLLLRRIHSECEGLRFPELARHDVLRVPRSRLLRRGELERAVELAARKVGSEGAILTLIDADDDPACELGPALVARARAARPDVTFGVVLAIREYETWFLAAVRSLAGREGLGSHIEPPPKSDAIRDAKGWLSRHMVGGSYREILHQPKLTAVMDLVQARSSQSFDKLWREVLRILSP